MKKQKAIDKIMAINPENKTSKEIAELTKLELKYVGVLLAQHKVNYKKVKRGTKGTGLKHPREDRVIHLAKQGLSNVIIRERTGVADNTIRNILARNNL
jgi:DNA-binding NarL/FixJ family response regulator